MNTNTNTNAITLAAEYTDARAAIASAESTYLAVCGRWHDAHDAGLVSVAALARAASITTGDAHATLWIGRAVRETSTDTLPYRGVVALEVDIRAILKSGKGATDDLADTLEDAASIADAADAIADLAAKRRKSATSKRQADKQGNAESLADPDAGDHGEDIAIDEDAPAPAPTRSAERLVADAVATLEQAIARVADGDTLTDVAILAAMATVDRLSSIQADRVALAS